MTTTSNKKKWHDDNIGYMAYDYYDLLPMDTSYYFKLIGQHRYTYDYYF